ncbi:hypothetical protein PF002_g12682 [Phytophthora fragariae]|uniref:Uncharacterized protein n=1 Tax=Phytophthora fragariae TaxID=53985 RepID=A0A6A3ZAF6_9STRA|nr:hypothetical protein PF002_g12682 [Phytophthora fragariae]
MQHTTEADSSAAAVTGGQVRVDNDCGVKNVYDTSDNRGQCSRAASAPARDVDDDAPMVAWCMLSIVDVVAVPRVDGGSLVLVKGIAPLPWQLALVRLPNKPVWRDLTDTVVEEELNLDLPLDELEIASDKED